VLGAVERSGKVVTRVVDRVKREELMSFLTERVERGSTIYTDELNLYAPLTALGYTHDTVQHRTKEYSRLNERGDRVHTNNLEGFWSYPKSAVLHVHRGV